MKNQTTMNDIAAQEVQEQSESSFRNRCRSTVNRARIREQKQMSSEFKYFSTAETKTNKSEVNPRLLSLQEAGNYLNVSYWHIRELIDRGKLPRVKLGRRVLVDIGDLNKLIEASKR